MNPLLRSLISCGYAQPTEIQEKVIPLALRSHNVQNSTLSISPSRSLPPLKPEPEKQPLLCFPFSTASTSSSNKNEPKVKFHHLHLTSLVQHGRRLPRSAAPLALIICPSRELAEQVMEATLRYAEGLPEIKIMGVYGALKTKSTQVNLRTNLSLISFDQRTRERSGYPRVNSGTARDLNQK